MNRPAAGAAYMALRISLALASEASPMPMVATTTTLGTENERVSERGGNVTNYVHSCIQTEKEAAFTPTQAGLGES